MKNFLIYSGLFLVGLFILLRKKIIMTRGEKNNNPFNMNAGNSDWLGEVKPSRDPRFAEFESPEYGIRAGLINLYNGYFSKGLTLAGIIAKYAPSSENDTSSYINAVSRRAGVTPLQVPDKNQWLKIASAILYHENGKNIASPEQLKDIAIKFNLRYI
jgi:hypothetical protein